MNTNSLARRLIQNWETPFFMATDAFLGFQVWLFQTNIDPSENIHRTLVSLINFNNFIANIYAPTWGSFTLVILLIAWAQKPCSGLSRKIYDFFGVYFTLRMLSQLIGLNILVFDLSSSRFLLISQLIFFLPFSLLIWGWLYWRIDQFAAATGKTMFSLDLERPRPRVIDYFVASFSSVFSASISGIKGRSARARILILGHGFMIYDVMGLTLSRAVTLMQR
jgi:hypothetical protein